MQRIRDELRRALVPVLAVVTAFFLGAIVIVLTDFEHLRNIGTDPLAAIGGTVVGVFDGYRTMLSGALGDPGRIVAAIQSGNAEDIAAAIRPVSETLVSATPFIFVGLGLAVSFRAGLINLGADGQFLIGGLGAAITALLVAGQLPPVLALVVAVLGGTIAGGAYGFVPGFLKARTGAHEVITTLMLNGIAPNLAFLIFGFIGPSGPVTPIPAVPPLIGLPTIRVDYGFVVSVAMAGVVSFLLFRTTRGFELRTTGFSRTVARGAGMRPGRTTMLAMSLSGGLVGMGSAFFGLGPAAGSGGAPFDLGYVAIALTLLAGSRPSGVVVAALFYGALTTGAKSMVIVTGVPLALLVVIVAFAIMFVAAPGLTRSIWRLRATPTSGG
jgi:general nucleoside transport system permease protein